MWGTGDDLECAGAGVLANDSGGLGSLSALLVTGHRTGFESGQQRRLFVSATNNFTGVDDFTYWATDGSTTSSVATVAVEVLPVGKLFLDNFTHAPLWPWIPQAGTWSISNNVLTGTNPAANYANAYVSNNWTDYLVQGQIQFSSTNVWGGGIGGRLVDPTNGLYYGAWVYPENSPGGSGNGTAILQLFKFHSWLDSSYTPLGSVTLTNGVGTNWHNLGLAFKGATSLRILMAGRW